MSQTELSYASGVQKPKVVFWNQMYLLGMGVMYVLVGAGVGALAWLEGGATDDMFVFMVVAVVCVPLALVHLGAMLLPRRRWTWVVLLVLIALGLTGACTLPAALPLLIFWIRPETQAWYRGEGA